MKLTFAIILIGCLHVSAGVHSQSKVSLNMQSADIKKVLTAIEKKTSFRFLYNSNLLSEQPKVSIIANNEDVLSVVNKILANTLLAYEVLNNNLVVLKKENTIIDQTVVKGRITNTAGEPLAAVSIRVKGSNAGTSTDADGRYSIEVPNDAVLVISSISYLTQEVQVNGRTEINIVLQPNNTQLEQVVVIGYGTAQKRDITGTIAKVAGKEVADKPNTNPLSSLQGKVSGVSIISTGLPGQEPDIRIRGTISRSQTKPLYVVDGLFNDNINFLNPSDIESIEILKDPSSLAIFGVRGANGVIIVTTKKGKAGQLTIGLNSSIGMKRITDKIKMTDATGFKTLYDEQRINEGNTPFAYYDKYNGNSNWVDLISKKNAIISNNNLSLSTGTDKNKFYFSVGYIKEQGLIKYENLDKILLSVSDELRLNKAIKLSFNLNGYRATPPPTSDFIAAINATPIVTAYNTERSMFNRLPDEIGGPQVANPLMLVEEKKNTDLQREYRAIGSVTADVTFLRDFNFKATYYMDLGFNDERRYTPIINVYSADLDAVSFQNGYNTTKVYQKNNNFSKFQQDYILSWKKNLGDHSITALGGFTTYFSSYQETNGSVTQRAGGLNIPRNKRFWYVDNFYGDPETKISGIASENDVFGNPKPLEWEAASISSLFRALYNYQGKYMLNFSFRRDGSSDISPDNRFQNFVAVGAAWEMSREKFMERQSFLDYLKIKASWGVLGNQFTEIHYAYLPQLINGAGAPFGNNIVTAFLPAYFADPNLQWEKVRSVEAGFELATLKNRLRVEAAYFNKFTKQLLTNYPPLNGLPSGITNAGEISNKGIEASATWTDKLSNGIGYSISGNITTLNNKVLSVYKPGFKIVSGNSITEAGYPIGYFFGYVVDGIYQSYADKLASPNASSLGEYGPGDFKYKDIAGPPDANGKPTGPDGKVDVNDRVLIGNPTPDFLYGFSLNADYKGFELGIDFQGVYGNEIYRDWGNGNTFAVFNYREERLNRWHGAGTSNWEPQVNDLRPINRLPSNYMIEDGSYLRIRNISLAYNVPLKDKRALIRSLRVFLNAQNLKTFKHNSGFSPEFGGSAVEFGVDRGSYPLPAIFSFGFNATF
ncbi:MAG: TonB-dependent receptor [Chitinophagaceae bacterium]|nr:TonB-dependent receptor [Chitinophagaceae bacterium]